MHASQTVQALFSGIKHRNTQALLRIHKPSRDRDKHRRSSGVSLCSLSISGEKAGSCIWKHEHLKTDTCAFCVCSFESFIKRNKYGKCIRCVQGHQSPWTWSYTWLLAACYVPGTKPGSSVRTVSAFNWLAFSPVPLLLFHIDNMKHGALYNWLKD